MNNHEELKQKYKLDEQVHPTGRAWEWWELSLDGKTWHTLDGLPQWSMFNHYRRKECAPTVYADKGMTHMMDDGTCDDWDKAISPTTVVTTEPVRVNSSVKDNINHPDHYTQGDIECIDAIKAALTPEEYRGYLKGNAIKYIWRERHKGGSESLGKANWYITRAKGETK